MAEETLTLAPASGAGVGKILADRLLSNSDFIPALEAAMMGGLKATRSFWSKEAGMVTEPDFRVQVQTAALLLAHMEGEPVKRIIHQHLGTGGKLDVGGALQDSPELAAAVEKELQKARWRTSGHQPHKKPRKAAEEKPGELAEGGDGMAVG